MTDLRTAAQQALELLERLHGGCTDSDDGTVEAITVWCPDIIEALEAALAEPVQEPVAWRFEARHIDSAWGAAVSLKHPGPEGVYMRNVVPLYTAPPQRKPMNEFDALRLITEAIGHLQSAGPVEGLIGIIRAVERAHDIT